MREHTNQHTTPLKRLYNVILDQYRPSPPQGRQHPPRLDWRPPGTRSPQGIPGPERSGSGGRPGTPETGVPGPSKHTRQHTDPVSCAGSEHTDSGRGLDQSRSAVLEPMPSASTDQGRVCVCDCAATRHAAQEPHWCLDCDCPAYFSQSAMGQIR